MDEDRKNLYFGWLMSSALITTLLFFLLPQLSSEPEIDYTIIIAVLVYSGVLFVWIMPFIFIRTFLSEIFSKEKDEKSEH